MNLINKTMLLLILIGVVSTNKAQTSKIDDYLNSVFKEHVVPGFSVVVVDNNKIIYSKGFGKEKIANQKPFTPNTVSSIGSLTKSITALAIMQLAEEGKMELDKPIYHNLPWFRTVNKQRSDKITTRMLLNHTSGLRAKFSPEYDLSDQSIEEMTKKLKGSFISLEPGSKYEYSNLGYSIAGLIINKVSGLSYSDYIEKNIFRPLNMNSSSCKPEEFELLKAINGHHFGVDKGIQALREPETESGEFIPAGSMTFTSSRDLGNYLICLLNDGKFNNKQIISKQSIDQMWTSEVSFPGLSKDEGGDGKDYYYGLGWMISDIDGRKIIHHGGSTGKSSSFTMIDKKNNLAVSIVANLDLTLINHYKYATLANITNNILHLTNNKPKTNFASVKVEDPTINSFVLQEKRKNNYAGEYDYKKGGDYWVFFGLDLSIFKRKDGKLQAVLTRDNQIINSFVLDFVNQSYAVSRNIALPFDVRFKISTNGKVNVLYYMGAEFTRKDENLSLKYKSNSFKNAIFLLPNNWQINKQSEEFSAFNKTDTTLKLSANFRNGGEIDTFIATKLSNEILFKGLIHTHTYGKYAWHQQSFISKKNKQHTQQYTVFWAKVGEQYVFLEFSTPQNLHSFKLQKVMVPLLQNFEYNNHYLIN